MKVATLVLKRSMLGCSNSKLGAEYVLILAVRTQYRKGLNAQHKVLVWQQEQADSRTVTKLVVRVIISDEFVVTESNLVMSFSEIEEQQLEHWVTAQLQSMKQRNPDVLAQLIVSLVKQDKSTDELKEYCIAELKAFLKSQTEDFVHILFGALEGTLMPVFDCIVLCRCALSHSQNFN